MRGFRERLGLRLAPSLKSHEEYASLLTQFKSYQLQAIEDRISLQERLVEAAREIVELHAQVEHLDAELKAAASDREILAAYAERAAAASHGSVVA